MYPPNLLYPIAIDHNRDIQAQVAQARLLRAKHVAKTRLTIQQRLFGRLYSRLFSPSATT